MNYKELIFNAVGDKFEEANIKEVLFAYDIKTGQVELFAVDNSEKKMEIHLSKTELMTVRMMLINKVTNQVKKDYPDKESKTLIVNLSVPDKELKMYIEFTDEITIEL